MSVFSEPAADAERQDFRRHGRHPARGTRRQSNIRSFHLCISVLPAAVAVVLGVAAVAALYSGDVATRRRISCWPLSPWESCSPWARLCSRRTRRPAGWTGSSRGCPFAATRTSSGGSASCGSRSRAVSGPARAGGAGRRRETAPRSEDVPATDSSDPFVRLAYELRQAQGEAWNAVLDMAERESAGGTDQRVDVFVNLARRMQSLAHRAIQGLDELENQVEDPDLLKGLFRVDHLSTRMRRQAESLAVIGGAASRRQWRAGDGVRGAALGHRRGRALQPRQGGAARRGDAGRPRGRRRHPPARRAHRERHQVRAAAPRC